MFRQTCLLTLLFCVASLQADAQNAPRRRAPNPALASIEDQSGLPRVLMIGDSISIGYTLPTRDKLKGAANVHRIPANGGPTTRGLESIDAWLGEKPWDVIHFNWGLHDLKYMNEKGQLASPESGMQQVPPEEYEKNLRQLVKRLQETKAQLIWRNTTPIPEGSQGRIPGDEVKYNEIAARIMRENSIPIHDLYSFVQPREKELMLPANVHFTKDGYDALAGEVARVIREHLPKKQ